MHGPTFVYNTYYQGPFYNYGQHSAGQGTIHNINGNPSSSEQPDSARNALSEDQRAEDESSLGTTIPSASQVLSEDQPTIIHPPLEIPSKYQPAELKGPPWPDSARNALSGASTYLWRMLDHLPARVDNPIANTNAGLTQAIPRNIVVFGQTGSGKTSIINLFTSSSAANVSGGPANCIKRYYISHGGDNYMFWDTPGLEEAEGSTSVSLPGDNVQNLLDLVRDHDISLLVYCIRGSLVDINRLNYEFFSKIICVAQVPVVLVVTGLEGKPDKWWQENINTIQKMKMEFAGHACITSWKGTHQKEYEGSAEKVWKLVREHCAQKPWHMTPGWSVQAQQKVAAYEKHFKARTMRKLLRDVARSLG